MCIRDSFGTELFDGSKHEDIVAAKDTALVPEVKRTEYDLSFIHFSEPTKPYYISFSVLCLQ